MILYSSVCKRSDKFEEVFAHGLCDLKSTNEIGRKLVFINWFPVIPIIKI